MLHAVDLFCGAGGWSLGWKMAAGCEPLLAVNHDDHAIRLHTLNHPTTQHFHEDIWAVDPRKAVAGRRVDWLHLSPTCTHFSRARGGVPKAEQSRSQAWVAIDWARIAHPAVISLENLAEWLTWGPLDAAGQPIRAQAGETFLEFVAALRSLGYVVDWRVLCAADFGAPTIRRRLFLVARRNGQPIRWPEPTHADPSKRDLFSGGLQPWRTAAECIDWSIPCPSIFDRKRPLAPATCRRIAAGIVRFVLQGRPFLVNLTHGGRLESIDEPVRTITCAHRGEKALVAPSLIQTGYGERAGQAPRVLDLEQPLGTVVAGGAKHALVAAFLQQNFTGMVGKPLRVPVPTITARDHHSLVTASLSGDRGPQVAAFLTTYYGAGGTANAVDKPMPAVVTKARHGLVTFTIDGTEFVMADIGLRMLEPRELARAQGFPYWSESREFTACIASHGTSSTHAKSAATPSLDASARGRTDAVVVRARIGFGQMVLSLHSPGRSLSFARSAGESAAFPLPTEIASIVRALAATSPSPVAHTTTGRAAPLHSASSSTRPRSGEPSADLCGAETALAVDGAASGGSQADASSTCTTLPGGHGSPSSDSHWRTLFSYVDHVIASSIRSATSNSCSFAVEVFVEDGYVLEGSKAAQIARVGNSVCPDVAAAIVRANLGMEAAVA